MIAPRTSSTLCGWGLPLIGLVWSACGGGTSASTGNSGASTGASAPSTGTGTTGGGSGGSSGSAGTSGGVSGGSTGGSYVSCNPQTGCSGGLYCTATGDYYACESSCQATWNCSDDYIDCQTGSCQVNFCGPGTGNAGTLYGPCDASGTDDGVCLPVLGRAGNVAAACVQGGGSKHGPCGYWRFPDGGTGAICQAGELCNPYTAVPYSACAPICATSAPFAPDGGPGCPAGTQCKPVFGTMGVCS